MFCLLYDNHHALPDVRNTHESVQLQLTCRNWIDVTISCPLLSARQHPSYGDCLEVKREYYRNCSVLGCVTHCSQSAAHSYEQFLQVQQIGFVHRGGFLELYYCNMVEWCWWDLSLIWKTNWFRSLLWHCWFVGKNRPRNDL